MRVLIAPSPTAFANISAAAAGIGGGLPSSGATQHFNIFCMPALLPAGAQVVADVLANCEGDYVRLCSMFGLPQPPPHFNVTLAGLSTYLDGKGGAFHWTCDGADIYCDVKLNPVLDSKLSSALLVAELVEVFEAVQSIGWNCGASNGEGLSRVLASALYPGIPDNAGYSCAADWLDGGRPDWVTATNFTDRDAVSNGCSVLALNWMNGPLAGGGLNIDWATICKAGGQTIAETYNRITGKNDAWQRFSAVMANMFPQNQPSGLKTDNPFLPPAVVKAQAIT